MKKVALYMFDKTSKRELHDGSSSSNVTPTSDFYKSLYTLPDSRTLTQSHEPLRLRGGSSSERTFFQRIKRIIRPREKTIPKSPEVAATEKGQLLLKKIEKVTKKTYKDTSTIFQERYVSKVEKDDMEFRKNVYDDIGNVKNYIKVSTAVKNRGGSEAPYSYINCYNVNEGVILASYNFKTLDQESISRHDALPNSEILWHQYQLAAQYIGKQSSDLRITKIVGYAIANLETRNVAKLFIGDGESKKFLKGSDEYFALLGTPAANGKAYLLEQHKNTFGNKEISAIEVKRTRNYLDYIVYHIGDKQEQ